VVVFEDFELLPPAARATPTPVPPRASAVAVTATATLRLGRNTVTSFLVGVLLHAIARV